MSKDFGSIADTARRLAGDTYQAPTKGKRVRAHEALLHETLDVTADRLAGQTASADRATAPLDDDEEDDGLQRIIDAWPDLDEKVRAKMTLLLPPPNPVEEGARRLARY